MLQRAVFGTKLPRAGPAFNGGHGVELVFKLHRATVEWPHDILPHSARQIAFDRAFELKLQSQPLGVKFLGVNETNGNFGDVSCEHVEGLPL